MNRTGSLASHSCASALVAVLLLIAGSPAAQAEGIVVATGPERGSYHHIGERLKTELLVARGRRIEILQTAGSVENLHLLDDATSPVNVALTQSDVLGAWTLQHPGFAERTVVLGDAGRECVLLIASARHEAASLSDLASGGGEVSVGGEQSGARATLESMIRIAPALGSLRPIAEPTLEALVRLRQGASDGGLVAAMMVQRPRRVSPGVETVLKQPDAYRWIPIREAEVGNGQLPDGSPLYTFERVAVGGPRGGGLAVDTLCTRGLLLAAKEKLTATERAMLSEAMLEAGERIIRPDE
jgi:hypothetical protein